MTKTKIQICGCMYIDDKGLYHNGIYILNTKTNTFTVINKKLEKVTTNQVITCADSLGNMFITL